MFNKASLAFVVGLTMPPQTIFAAENPTDRCVDTTAMKKAVTSRDGKWVELTPAQWQFLRGVYAVNPGTPVGLPYGDKAALAQIDGNAGGLVFFLDGEMACTPMPVPHELLDMMRDVDTDRIMHEQGGS
jgi:hypothetical protein